MNRPGRPSLNWLTHNALLALPVGTAIAVETTGRHERRIVARIVAASEDSLVLDSPRGPITLHPTRVKRSRVLAGLYEPGDPVVQRGVDVADWRGGVVRTEGTEVLVEQIDGSFAWFGEDRLEPADVRDHVAPTPRGPVPARAGR
jgi:hypothetical protein